MNILQRMLTRFNLKGEFFKAVSILAGGTLLAQIINVVTLPILTRLYTPADFAIFAVYNSLLMTFSVISCLRFEIAIPLATDDKEATDLIYLALISNFFISFTTLVLLCLFEHQVLQMLNIKGSKFVIWLLPLGLLFLGIYNVLQYAATRNKSFKIISKTKITQAVGGIGVQIILGLFKLNSLGLVIGQVIKYSSGSISLLRSVQKNLKYLLNNFNVNDTRQTLIKNQNYPKFSSLEALANAAGIQLPIIVISSKMGEEAGYLMLAMQVMAIPLMLLGNAISQVYMAHATEKLREGQLKSYTYECILKILKVGIVPLVLICSVSPFLFPIVFGEKWHQAGIMVLWMLPWYAMQLLVSPISISLYVVNQQKIALLVQLVGLLIRLGGTYFVSLSYNTYTFKYYAFSGCVFYIIYLIVVLKLVRNH